MSIKAKTVQYDVEFPPSPHPDVVGYRMYYCPSEEEIIESSPFIDLGNNLAFQVPGPFEELKGLDGEYRIAGMAYDKNGNYGATGEEVIVPLDFQPPGPPGAFLFTLKG